MFSFIFNTFFYNPLYNILIFFLNTIPFVDVGIAIILLTLLVKFVLFPLSKKAIRTQRIMKKLDPEMKAVREKYKKDRNEQGKKLMELYRTHKINPFSSIFLILLQLPIVIALYWIFYRGGLPVIDTSILYSFISSPVDININFLGLIDVTERNIFIAFLAGATQYIQIRLSMPDIKPRDGNASFQEDFARSMQLQMRYVFPLFVFGFSYFISAAIALYWLTSNIFAIGQEIVVRKQMDALEVAKTNE